MGEPLSYRSRVREVRHEARTLIARLRAERLGKRAQRPALADASAAIAEPRLPAPSHRAVVSAADTLLPSRRILLKTPGAPNETIAQTPQGDAIPHEQTPPAPDVDHVDTAVAVLFEPLTQGDETTITPPDLAQPEVPGAPEDDVAFTAEVAAEPAAPVEPTSDVSDVSEHAFFVDVIENASCSLDDRIEDVAATVDDMTVSASEDVPIDYAAMLVAPVLNPEAGAQTLECVPKLGAGMIWRLGQLGYTTLNDLAIADAGVLRQKLGAVGNMVNVEGWIAFARSVDPTAARDQPITRARPLRLTCTFSCVVVRSRTCFKAGFAQRSREAVVHAH